MSAKEADKQAVGEILAGISAAAGGKPAVEVVEDLFVDYLTGQLPPDIQAKVEQFLKDYQVKHSEDTGKTWRERSH